MTKLESLQRLGTLLTSGAFRSSPSASLEVALGLLPLDLHIKSLARKTAYRLMVADLWRDGRSRTGHTSIKAIPNSHVLDMGSDVMSKEQIFTKPFSVELLPRSEWSAAKGPYSDRGRLVWYTDGSLIEGKSGYGVYGEASSTAISGSLGAHCSIFQAEIYGILTCANLGLASGYRGRHIAILSDSQAALKALDSSECSSKLVWECFNAICELGKKNFVLLGWVPGHSGVGGNESADKLAKAGAIAPFYGPEPCCGISKATAYKVIDDWAKEQHRLRWRTYPGQTTCKKLLPMPSPPFTRWLLGQGRDKVRRVIALITGHGHFRKHLHTLGIFRDEPVCRLCGISFETARHIILECEGLGARRRALFGLSTPGDEPDASFGKKLLSLVEGTDLGLPI